MFWNEARRSVMASVRWAEFQNVRSPLTPGMFPAAGPGSKLSRAWPRIVRDARPRGLTTWASSQYSTMLESSGGGWTVLAPRPSSRRGLQRRRAAARPRRYSNAYPGAWRITDGLVALRTGWTCRRRAGRRSGVWRIARCASSGPRASVGAVAWLRSQFWCADEESATVTAPRENRAAKILDRAEARLVSAERDGRTVQIPAVLDQTMLEDITFPIDVVYTWVDGADPAWLARKAEASGEGPAPDLHAEATDPARFRSRDDSVVVTDRRPSWLNTEDPRITWSIPRHLPGDGRLPVFARTRSSGSIIGG